MNFGGIQFEGVLGSYQIALQPATSLPQDLASAWSQVNSNLLGATYEPLWLVGRQMVNGINYLLIAKEVRTTATKNQMIVGVVINIPPTGSKNNPKIVEIIEEARLSDELAFLFNTASKQLIGVGYKPLAYVGSQMVKGKNYYFICEARPIYPNAEPYGVVMCINEFEKNINIVSIEKIS